MFFLSLIQLNCAMESFSDTETVASSSEEINISATSISNVKFKYKSIPNIKFAIIKSEIDADIENSESVKNTKKPLKQDIEYQKIYLIKTNC